MLRQPLVHFVLLGSLLFLASNVVAPSIGAITAADRETIRVNEADIKPLRANWIATTGRGPDEAELNALINQHVNEELLFREALNLGMHERDHVVRERLIKNMRFVDPSTTSDSSALVEKATELGMIEHDLLVRRRLIQKMQHRIESGVRVTEAELNQFYSRHIDQYQTPQRYDFRQLFFNKRPQAEAALVELTQGQNPSAIKSDQFLLGTSFNALSGKEIRLRLGAEIEQAVGDAPDNWFGPVQSVYGHHLLRVSAVIPSATEAFQNVKQRVTTAVFKNREQAAMQKALKQLRNQYDVELNIQIPDSTS